MSKVLEGQSEFAHAYLDDILVHSETLEDHKCHLQAVMDRLRQHNLKLKISKCHWLQEATEYLGFIITKDGVKPDPKKIEVMRSVPQPTCVKEIRSFIGMMSYYRKFVPNFSEIAKPLINLTKKRAKFEWDEKCQTAFEFLKESLTTVPVLAYPDPEKPYVLYTDASDSCIGAVLCQACDPSEENPLPKAGNEKPIYFLSHKLSPSQCKWLVIEKECYAIHFALNKLDHYLHNSQFVIKTDHKPLKYLLSSPMQNKKIQMWALGISGYNCTIEYIQGKKNCAADYLSRLPGQKYDPNTENQVNPDIDDRTFEVNIINSDRIDTSQFIASQPPPPEKENDPKTLALPGLDMTQEQAKDKEISTIIKQIKENKAPKSITRKHTVINDILYYVSDPEDDPVI